MPRRPDGAQQDLALLEQAAEDGDLAGAICGGVEAGHVFFLLADAPLAWLARAIGAAIRDRLADPSWPPVLTITTDTWLLALVGGDYGTAQPLCRQAEMLVCNGDVVLLLAGGGASPGLAGAAEVAASRGAVMAGLGPVPPAVECHPKIALPEAPADQLALCELALGRALAASLARQLPAERPAALTAALLSFACANCGAPLAVPRHLAGRRGTCPHCYNNTIASEAAEADNESRAHMRFALRECTLAVSLAPPRRPAVHVPGRTTLENLSRSGLLFIIGGSPVEIRPGDTVLIDLATPAFEHELRVAGSVNRVTREAARQHVGVVFDPLPPAVAERLRLLERNIVLRNVVVPAARRHGSTGSPCPEPVEGQPQDKPSES